MLDTKLSDFIRSHKTARAVSFKVAQAESGLDLMASAKVEDDKDLDGILVAKTWTKSKSGMLWCYLMTGDGVLFSFPVFWRSGDSGPFTQAEHTHLGTHVKVAFTKSKSGKIYCDSISTDD